VRHRAAVELHGAPQQSRRVRAALAALAAAAVGQQE
jgi:hypothetical protein